MYFLNYLENSDAACQSSTTPHAHFQDCARQMHDEFEEVRKSLGIRAEDLPEPSEDCEAGIFSGYLDVWTAYLRNGIDTYRWTIVEEPRFVPAENLFVVHGLSHDPKNGNVLFCKPSIHCSKASAQKQLRTLFNEKLKEYGLEENNACDEKGECVPGGRVFEDEALIYDYAPYACDCLIEVAAYIISTVESVDTTMGKKPGVVGRFVSVWDGGMEVSSPCYIDFESGLVTITGSSDCSDVAHLEHLENEYVEANGQTYCVVSSGLHQHMIENGDIKSDGTDMHGKPVLWY